ncbi:MAG: hypothetical protein GXY81_08075 [Candidatus Cloacimonetes bacterium]|nr:hypothetical protein [Candidatus Cloacimonadota bacterium]
MRFEEEEKRDFRPGFFAKLRDLPNPVFLEETYGKKLGYIPEDYLQVNSKIQFLPRDEVWKSDIVISVRTPPEDELKALKRGSIFFSMLHYPTRRKRTTMLADMGVRLYSMDAVTDEFGHRMIQDFSGTVNNALVKGMEVLDRQKPHLEKIRVLILGSGELGKLAVDHAIHASQKPVIAVSVGRKITGNQALIKELLQESDILIDATFRNDPRQHILENEQIGHLPPDSIIIDISADDYDVNMDPIQVKAIEGIPTGNLGRYILAPDDVSYEKIPPQVCSKERRTVVSCNAWPGVNPHACLDRYEIQVEHFIRIMAVKAYDLDPSSSDPYERALHRAKNNEKHRL